MYDHQKSEIGGLNDEFIFSARLDNLTSCFAATESLIESADDLANQKGIQLISLFDHEEIGSRSLHGADSSFLPDVLLRLTRIDFEGNVDVDFFHEVISKSFCSPLIKLTEFIQTMGKLMNRKIVHRSTWVR